MRKYLILLFVVNFLSSNAILAWNDPTNSGSKSKKNNSVMLDVLDEGSGFKENDTKKIFKRLL